MKFCCKLKICRREQKEKKIGDRVDVVVLDILYASDSPCVRQCQKKKRKKENSSFSFPFKNKQTTILRVCRREGGVGEKMCLCFPFTDCMY